MVWIQIRRDVLSGSKLFANLINRNSEKSTPNIIAKKLYAIILVVLFHILGYSGHKIMAIIIVWTFSWILAIINVLPGRFIVQQEFKIICVNSDSFTILGLWVLGLAVSNINESQLQTYESKTLFLMTSLQYYCIPRLARTR